MVSNYETIFSFIVTEFLVNGLEIFNDLSHRKFSIAHLLTPCTAFISISTLVMIFISLMRALHALSDIRL